MPHPNAHSGINIAIVVSGQSRGSNMMALIDACRTKSISGQVAVVIGTRADSPALERARAAGISTSVVSPKKYESDELKYGDTLLRILHKVDADLICLAGYMRILPKNVVDAYDGKIMNTHPALLPLFGGQGMYGERVHKAVLESGMKVTGCTVHFVDHHYDNGPIILQTPVLVLDEDTPETLASRVLPAEHQTYCEAVRLFSEHRLEIVGRRVKILKTDQS